MAIAMIGYVTMNTSSPSEPRTALTSLSSMRLRAVIPHDLFNGAGHAVDVHHIHTRVERKRDHRVECLVRRGEVARRPAERLPIIRVVVDRDKVDGCSD